MMSLILANKNELLEIKAFKGGKQFKKKIDNIGLYKGSKIKILKGGNKQPFIIEKDKSRIAIGFGMASKIMVEKVN